MPRFFRNLYFENKQPIGKVDEIFGPIDNYLFSVNLEEGVDAKSVIFMLMSSSNQNKFYTWILMIVCLWTDFYQDQREHQESAEEVLEEEEEEELLEVVASVEEVVSVEVDLEEDHTEHQEEDHTEPQEVVEEVALAEEDLKDEILYFVCYHQKYSIIEIIFKFFFSII